MSSVLVTVDVEDFFEENRPSYDLLFARTPRGTFGLTVMMDALEEVGGRATFFFDALNFEKVDEGVVREAAREVVRRGHEAGLHTHPEPPRGRRGLGMSQVLWRHRPEEQRRLIREGTERLESWTGRRPVSHRAGGYGASLETLRILTEEGFLFDSSLLPGYVGSPLAATQGHRLRAFLCEGLVELPVTVTRNIYAPGLSLRKKLDINWGPTSELILQVDACLEAGLSEIVVFLHSYSFLNERRLFVGVPRRVRAFRDLLEAIRGRGLRFARLQDLERDRIPQDRQHEAEIRVDAWSLLANPRTYTFVIEQYGWAALKTLLSKRLG